jgi:hypothetical protein
MGQNGTSCLAGEFVVRANPGINVNFIFRFKSGGRGQAEGVEKIEFSKNNGGRYFFAQNVDWF